MPELPEVETVRLFLNQKIIGKKIKSIQVLNAKSLSGDYKKILNQPIISLNRIGKQLSIHFSHSLSFLIHLKMTGQLIFVDKSQTILGHPTPSLYKTPLPWTSTRIIFTFSDGSMLYFNDQRKFGWIKLVKLNQLKSLQSNLGPDILSRQFTLSYFQKTLQNSNRFIKTLLHDQSLYAGIGNIYANDALFLSHIHPQTRALNITSTQAKSLYQNIKKVIRQGIKYGGSTAKDNMYLKPDGTKGQQQYNFYVYQRAGEPCPNCHSKIIRLKLQGRSAFFCPHCQKPSN